MYKSRRELGYVKRPPAILNKLSADDERRTRVAITSHADIVSARERARVITKKMGFGDLNAALIVTAVTELTNNIVRYAVGGSVHFKEVASGGKRGLRITVSDEGPGIPNIERAMQEGYSTKGGMGIGLPGCRRLMDEFDIRSEVGKGTVIVITKWL